MNDKRLTDLEIKLTFLEQTVETLNEVVIDQSKRMDAMRSRIDDLKSELEAGKEGGPIETPPPHY